MADPFGNDDTDFDTDEMTRYCYEVTVALLRDKNSEGESLRGENLPDDVANPVQLIPPRNIHADSMLGVLVAKVGEAALSMYDWSHYTLEAGARTYHNRDHWSDQIITPEEQVRRAKIAVNDPSATTSSGSPKGRRPPAGFGRRQFTDPALSSSWTRAATPTQMDVVKRKA